jgi:cytidine deaminase
MEKKEILFAYTVFNDLSELTEKDRHLLKTAQAATVNAYAPYSKFHVAASALLSDGNTIVSATNQENASYPVGICAERTLLGTVASMYPGEKITDIAVSYFNHAKDKNNKPVSPCGMCRQALLEWEERQQQGFRIILAGKTGVVYIIEKASSLLPLSFFHEL